ncbi:MAG: MinD/ParA family protein [Nitrospirae bacterium]|nr:MinD/ParA family protein [Nitrospirota bacterium]MBI3351496.1 MinD/ParA family protein [Nitrospirota bacterium]
MEINKRVNFPKVIAVTSGKGGVGKTNVVANLAVSLSKLGQSVVVLDADLGLGNLDVLFGKIPDFTLEDVILGNKSLAEVIIDGPSGIRILPTSSGAEDLTFLSDEQKLNLLAEFDRLERKVDVLLIDTGAGISSNVIYFNTIAQEIIVISSPEPTSMTDAYAVMKVLSQRHGEKKFKILVNMARNEKEGKEVFQRLRIVSDKYLNVSLEYIGFISRDDYLPMAVAEQRAVVEKYPSARSSREFNLLAKNILDWPADDIPKGNIQLFWKGMVAGAF